jgi:FdhE protein
MVPALQRWLRQNPFLVPLAHFDELMRAAAEAVPAPVARLPPLDLHAAAHAEGVPLLLGEHHGPPLRAAAAALLGPVADRAAASKLPPAMKEGVEEVARALRRPEAPVASVDWLLKGADPAQAPVQAGLLLLLGWRAFARVLAPHGTALDAWRASHAWERPRCPTCGALPVMSQAVGAGRGGRTLACGCCATRWSWAGTGCPYCEAHPGRRMTALALQGAAPVRLEVCPDCRGYLKVYTAAGEEPVFLADWPTLALDGLALEQGYRRRGASLWEL